MEYVLFGAIAGILAGLFGIGGGIVIVPLLIVVAKFAPHRASGTSLAALLLPVGFLGVWKHYSYGNVDVKAGLLIGLGLFIGAYFGAELAVRLPARELQRLFSVFLGAIAVYLWITAK